MTEQGLMAVALALAIGTFSALMCIHMGWYKKTYVIGSALTLANSSANDRDLSAPRTVNWCLPTVEGNEGKEFIISVKYPKKEQPTP